MSAGLRAGYKQTEVGLIPEDWEVKSLGAVLRKGRLGGNYPNQDAEAAIPLMKMGNLARGYIDLSKVQFVTPGAMLQPVHRLSYGDVLFNTRNTLDLVGKVAIWRNELPIAYYNSNLMRLEFDPEEICANEYANYSLNTESAVTRLRALATGTTSVAAIYTRDLVKLQVVVPPLPEQRAIAAALSDVDALLGGLDRLIAKKQGLKVAAMQQLLTGQTRLPGFSGEWEVRRVGDFTDCTAGGTPSTSIGKYWGGKIRWMSSGELNLKSVHEVEGRITEMGLSNSSTKIIPEKCVLIGLAGQGKTRGTVAMNHVELSTNQSIAAIFPNSAFVPEYLYYNLDSRYDELREMSAGDGGRGGLNLTIIKAISIPFPPMPEQTAITAILSDMDTELAALQERRSKTQALKQAMMQELLTGRIRLV